MTDKGEATQDTQPRLLADVEEAIVMAALRRDDLDAETYRDAARTLWVDRVALQGALKRACTYRMWGEDQFICSACWQRTDGLPLDIVHLTTCPRLLVTP